MIHLTPAFDWEAVVGFLGILGFTVLVALWSLVLTGNVGKVFKRNKG